MGEARRRAAQGLPPRLQKPEKKADDSPRVVPWLPLTQNQTKQFVNITTRGAWIGIALLVVFWITVRFVGPAAGWWTLMDTP
ncbi:MAG: DUF2839 family protein [Synechococcus sp. TMED20]|jgi:hypothetical protein|nr:MAG: DUF2839 family protein [Synechococcus sp. TMED20]|tara:strand:+ start:1216 stop:1461 length:246 start_codon:yes stop_codon:yes gene_type:complete